MKILFDLQSTQPQIKAKYHGAGKYGWAVLKKIIQIAPNNVAVYYDGNKFLDGTIKQMILTNNIPIYLSSDFTIYEAALKESGVLYIPMLGAHEFPYPPKGIKLITTIHDLRHFVLKRDKYYKYTDLRSFSFIKRFLGLCKERILGHTIRRKIFKRIDSFLSNENVSFVTVSEHSKYCLLDNCPNLVKKDINVFWAPSTVSTCNISDRYINPYGKYWLLVGANRYEKNCARAVIAFDELFSKHKNIEGHVIITGISSWKQLKIPVKNPNRFILMGYVDEDTLKCLYRYAYTFVYPTLNEGFGYPPIEAMAEGCPIIASSVSSIPEICDNAVLYFNPYLIDELKNRILQMENNEIHINYINKSKIKYKEIEKRQTVDLERLSNYILSFIN